MLDGRRPVLLNIRSVKLTKRLVESGGRAPRGRRRAGRRPEDGSRERLFAAAAREFAARGYDATSVDRIAAAARLNKAMIYYHFRSKAALYREILRDMFQAVGGRIRAVVESSATPDAKIGRFIEAIAAEAEARPHFPAIWFREIGEGGTHLDAAVVKDIAGVIESLSAILDEGRRSGRFQDVSPVMIHASIVAPLLLFFASAELRSRLARGGVPDAARLERDEIVAHLRRVTLGVLEGRI